MLNMITPNQKTILIVEDDFILAKMGQKTLEQCGYKTFTANTGEQAIDLFKKNNNIDLILMDIDLGSGIDGTEAAAIILKDFDIPVVFLSSHTEPEIVEKTEKITSYGYVVKGTGITVLDASIKMAFKLFDARKKELEKEKALQESEQNYRNIFDNAIEGMFRTSIDGKSLMANSSLVNILGYDSTDEYLRAMNDSAHQVWHNANERSVYLSLLEKQEFVKGYECQLKRLDGTPIWVSLNAKLTRDENGNKIYNEGFLTDITNRKKTEFDLMAAKEKTEESEKKLQGMLDNMLDAFFQVDLNGNVTFANPAALTMYRYSSISEIIGIPASTFYAIKEERDELIEELRKFGKKTDWNGKGLRKDGTTFWASMNAQVIRDKNGNIIGTQGVARDITERKQTEETLRESENKFRSIVEHSPYAKYFYQLESDDRLILTGANSSADRIIGINHQILLGKTIEDAFPKLKDTEIPAIYRKVAKGEIDQQSFEIPYKDERFSGYYEVKVYKIGANKIAVDFIDISKRKQIEDALRESEFRYRHLFEAIPESVLLIGTDGRVVAANMAAARLHGYETPQQLEGFYTPLLIAEKDRERATQTQADLVKGKERPARYYTEVRRDGSEFDAEVMSTTLRGEQQEVLGYIGITRDITEKNLIEKKLQIKNLVFDVSIAANSIADINGIIIEANDMFLRLWGCQSKDEVIGKHIQHFFKDSNNAVTIITTLDVAGAWEGELTAIKKDESTFFAYCMATVLRDEKGKLFGYQSSLLDITERKRTEKTIQENEKRFRALIENSFDAITLLDSTGKIIYESPSSFKVTGYSVEEQVGKCGFDVIHPDDVIAVQKAYGQLMQMPDKTINMAMRTLHKNGTYLQMEVTATNLLNEPCVEAIVVNFRDVTDRKRAEDALRKSEELFKSVVQNGSGLTMLTDETGKVSYLSPQCENVLGYPADKFIGRIIPDIIHPDDVVMCKNAFDQVFLHGQKVTEFEYRIIDADNNVRWISHNANTFKFNESFSGIQSSIHNITERKMMEEKLRESENNYRTLSDSGQALIWTAGTDKLCNYFNRVWFEFTGRTFEQEYGNGWAEGVHPDDFQHCLNIYTGSFDRREKFSMEYRVRRHDGEYRWLLDEGSPRYNSKGEFIGYIGHCFDINERKIAEEKIKTLLQEKELILKEAHHRIKNNMSTVSSIMWLQLETLKEPSAIAALNDARSRVQSMMVLYDKLYRSNDFKDLSFKQYITPLVDEIIDNFPNKGMVKTEKYIDDFMIDAKILSALGIIINEILTNIMKYAFTGRGNGLIKITAKILDNCMTVTIADNGIGIPESINIATSSGFGLQLVDMMTKQLRGTIKIERNNGTKFILEFNL